MYNEAFSVPKHEQQFHLSVFPTPWSPGSTPEPCLEGSDQMLAVIDAASREAKALLQQPLSVLDRQRRDDLKKCLLQLLAVC
jgi:hypothetical protein